MAKYICSDVFGDENRLREILKKSGFNWDNDILIILGNAGLTLLLGYLRPFIDAGRCIVLLGSQEYKRLRYAKGTLPKNPFSIDGNHDLDLIDEMSSEERTELVAFLESLPVYLELETPRFGKALLSHSGYVDEKRLVYNDNGTINTVASIDKCMADDLGGYVIASYEWIMNKTRVLLDRFIIFGHISTIEQYDGTEAESIYRGRNCMNVNTGNDVRYMGGKLALYCLDTDEEWYV